MTLASVTAICLLLPAASMAQVDTAWVRRYNGPASSADYAQAMAIDGTGNVYVTGYSVGVGTDVDYATVRYNSTGVQQWVARYNGPGNDYDVAYAIAVDGSGGVYVTGYSVGSSTSYDYATIKYNSVGVAQWVRRYDGPARGGDFAYAMAVDDAGNVHVTGWSDNHPHPDTESYDYATIKYRASTGDTMWVRRYDPPWGYTDGASAIAVDGSGNVYVTGESYGFTDDDYATVKYDSAGAQQWVARYNGPGNYWDNASAIAVDDSGHVYVTGRSIGALGSYDWATIKYSPGGEELWVRRFETGGTDEATAVAVDDSGNVYVTGDDGDDYVTIRYSSSGVEQWVARYNGPGNWTDEAHAIAVDGLGSVYVTGESQGTHADYATVKYSSSGVEQWVARYNGPDSWTDVAYAMAVDSSGNVYVTGGSYGPDTDEDYATVKYVQSGAIEEDRLSHSGDHTSLVVHPTVLRSAVNLQVDSIQHSACRAGLLDISGRKVLDLKPGPNDVSALSPGVYFVRRASNVGHPASSITKIVVTK